MTNAEEARHTSSLDLDVVVHLDETWYQEGYQEGGEAGRRRGRREGRAVGYVRTISRKSLMRGRLSGGFTRRGEIVWFGGISILSFRFKSEIVPMEVLFEAWKSRDTASEG
jgi:hypothetical protein